jgi:hypothetical protein
MHCAKLVRCLSPQTRSTSPAQVTPGDAGLGIDLKEQNEGPLDAVVEAEIRNSSRPGSQAPHAPPALTFGLPGKQRVK